MDGFCPQCLEAGKVGQACATAKCLSGGYACIPGEERAAIEAERKAAPEREPEPLGLWKGDYLIVRRLGQGGMGSVYLALKRNRFWLQFAIKIPHSIEPAALSRFEEEARTLAGFRHPNIVQVVDYQVLDYSGLKLPFLVMTYVAEGRTLWEVLRANLLSGEQHRSVLRQVADGLETMHLHHFVHRDIKPGNILVELNKLGEARAVVVDLGLAKDLKEDSQTSQARGTVAYMAPEQLEPDPETRRYLVGPAADWYALGGVAWWMLTGKPIFDQMAEIGIRVGKARGISPREHLAMEGHPPAVVDFLTRCLAKDPKQRISSKAEFVPLMEAAFASLDEGTRPDVFGPPTSSGGEGVLPPGPNSKAGTKPVKPEERLPPDTADSEPPIDSFSPETNGRAWPRWMLGWVPVAGLGLVSVLGLGLAWHQTNQVSLSDRFAHLVEFATLKPDADPWRPSVDAGMSDAAASPVADAVAPEPSDQGVLKVPDAAVLAPPTVAPPTEAPRPLDLDPLNRALEKGDCKSATAELKKVRPRLKAAQRAAYDGETQTCWNGKLRELEGLLKQDCGAYDVLYRKLSDNGVSVPADGPIRCRELIKVSVVTEPPPPPPLSPLEKAQDYWNKCQCDELAGWIKANPSLAARFPPEDCYLRINTNDCPDQGGH